MSGADNSLLSTDSGSSTRNRSGGEPEAQNTIGNLPSHLASRTMRSLDSLFNINNFERAIRQQVKSFQNNDLNLYFSVFSNLFSRFYRREMDNGMTPINRIVSLLVHRQEETHLSTVEIYHPQKLILNLEMPMAATMRSLLLRLAADSCSIATLLTITHIPNHLLPHQIILQI